MQSDIIRCIPIKSIDIENQWNVWCTKECKTQNQQEKYLSANHLVGMKVIICFIPEYSILNGYWTIEGVGGDEKNFVIYAVNEIGVSSHLQSEKINCILVTDKQNEKQWNEYCTKACKPQSLKEKYLISNSLVGMDAVICFTPEYAILNGYWTIEGVGGDEKSFVISAKNYTGVSSQLLSDNIDCVMLKR